MFYCSLNDAKSVMAAGSKSEATQDDLLMQFVRRVTNRINLLAVGRSEDYLFLPQIKTRQVPIDGSYINSRLNTLALNWPLLALTAVDANGSAITDSVAGYPSGDLPYRQVRASSSVCSWYSYLEASCGDPAYAAITGIWGYHSDYSNAWADTGADLAAALTDSAVGMTTTGVADDDLFGFPQRLSRGMLIKIDSEYLWVLGTDEASKKAGLRRGAMGSTAAAHDSGASIYAWQVEEPIRQVTARQAAFMYARRGAYETATFDGAQSIQYPSDLLHELAAVLTEYQYI